MWLKLSEGLYYFGQGGINRIEMVDERYTNTTDQYKTILYANNVKMASVKETIDEIHTKIQEIGETW